MVQQVFTSLSVIFIFSPAAEDRLTSRSSTFPYTAEKCSQLLQLLSLQRGTPKTLCISNRLTETFHKGRALDGHTLCFVGGWEIPIFIPESSSQIL
jgi:hypothetical protein